MAASILAVAVAGAAGFLVGMFFNVGLSRRTAPPDEVCPRCKSPVSFIGNVPFVSWFWIRLRCTSCDWQTAERVEWIPWLRDVARLHAPRGLKATRGYLLVGLAFAVTWAAWVAAWGVSLETARIIALSSLLLAIAISDALIMIIPAEYTLAGIVIGLLASALGSPPGFIQSVLGCLTGAGVIWLIGVLGTWAFKKEAMGGGDIDLMAMVGAFLGVKAVFLTIFLGALVGTIIYAPLLLLRREWGRQLPFGVYLALGALVTCAAGDAIVAGYLRLVLGP